jgi:predicted DsbA family dithiol-disulfide isomerase
MTAYLAKAGAEVICADVNDELLAYAEHKMDSLQLNVEIRKIPERYCGLIKNEADVALLINTYHHIDTRVHYFSQLRELLKPEGELVIIDFFKKELPYGPPISMKLSTEEVVSELKSAGFSEFEIDSTTLPYQYMIKAKKTMSHKVKIEIWSDMVCPFCFIGKRKLEQAIQKLKAEDEVEIIWYSFQLDPNFPKNTSESATKSLVEKKGISEAQLNVMYNSLQQNGANYGIDFQFNKCLTFNTLDAHRLWHWSKAYNKQNEWKEAVMSAYFSEGRDLSSHDALLEIVRQLGLNDGEAQKVLSSEMFLEDVQQDIYQSRTLGVGGVPYFLINEKAAISGAQDDRVFENTLLKALGR